VDWTIIESVPKVVPPSRVHKKEQADSTRRYGSGVGVQKASGEGKMRSKENRYIGSTFDEFLIDEGIWSEVTSNACKKAIAQLVHDLMDRDHLTKQRWPHVWAPAGRVSIGASARALG
jgi:hypothetical protein